MKLVKEEVSIEPKDEVWPNMFNKADGEVWNEGIVNVWDKVWEVVGHEVRDNIGKGLYETSATAD